MLKGIVSFLIILALLTVAFVIGSQNEGVIVGILIMLASWLRLKVQLMSAQSKMQHLEKDH